MNADEVEAAFLGLLGDLCDRPHLLFNPNCLIRATI
jgi:hypothetical protein